MRIGSENVGRNGAIVLGVALVGSIGLAYHGYGHGIAPGGAALSVTSTSAASSGNSSGSSKASSTPKSSSSSSTTSTTSNPNSKSTTTSAPSQKLGPLLSSTQYASVAYRIYPAPESSRAKLATAGFNVSVKISGNTETLSVSSTASSAAPQTSTFQKGDSVYFVETAFGDDSGNRDYSAGDDGIIVTNAQGKIVE